jgi:Neocarzinostatin family
MSRRWVPAGLLGGVVGLMLAVSTGGTALAVSSVPPTLKAAPHSVMVNTDTMITGKGFMPGSSVQLTECSATNWVVPKSPCNTANTVIVTTNNKGKFKSTFKVGLCPGGKHGQEPTSEICYIGMSKPSGIDTIRLSPYAKVMVTYP